MTRNRSTPFWSHPALKALPDTENDTNLEDSLNEGEGVDVDAVTNPYLCHNLGWGKFDDVDVESDDNLIDTATSTQEFNSTTFKEEMQTLTELLCDFADGCEHQIQFGVLKTLEKEGAALFRLARNCLDRKHRMNSSWASSPTTWESSTSNALFYRSRTPCRDQ